MKPVANQARQGRAFTIVELLTVMSIIVILIGLMVPALTKVRRYATDVKQKAQFNAMNTSIELFNNEMGGYPPSSAMPDATGGATYCGAMKLCEALMGQDLLGFHANSLFRQLDTNPASPTSLYPANPTQDGLKARKGPYLQAENANAYRMEDIFTDVGNFASYNFVLCDVYERQMKTNKKTGMPILYYRADTANSLHDPNAAAFPTIGDNAGFIYNYTDNAPLVGLGKPWEANASAHKLADPRRFYLNTQNHKIATARQPFRADTFILISAGYDGEYGTADDICNFEWNYKDQP